MELEAEVHSHPHKIGHRWIDLALAISALALSIGSIILSIQNESNMKRLVTANSWPYIQLSHGNLDEHGARVVHFDAGNAGVGPAILEKLVVTYNGEAMSSGQELLQRCCGFKAHSGQVMTNLAVGHVFSPRETMEFLAVTRTDEDPSLFDKLNAERFKVDLSACYSSVFGEHWITSLRHPHATSVASCEKLTGKSFDSDLYGGDR